MSQSAGGDGPAGFDGGAPNGAAGAPSLRVLAQYLKDLSFENPRAPASFRDAAQAPNIEVNVDVNARGLGPNQYEVELAISARARRSQDVVFMVETTYAGLFEILNVPNEHLEPIMLVECPRLLFPFARQIIAETSTAGNFPPLMLDPIDFLSIYQRRAAQTAGEAAPAVA
jgi:preprotein translocase subunit SecB